MSNRLFGIVRCEYSEVFGGVVFRAVRMCSDVFKVFQGRCLKLFGGVRISSDVFGVVPGVLGNVLGGVRLSSDEFGVAPGEFGA